MCEYWRKLYEYCNEPQKHKGWTLVLCDDARSRGNVVCNNPPKNENTYLESSKREGLNHECPVCYLREEEADYTLYLISIV